MLLLLLLIANQATQLSNTTRSLQFPSCALCPACSALTSKGRTSLGEETLGMGYSTKTTHAQQSEQLRNSKDDDIHPPANVFEDKVDLDL